VLIQVQLKKENIFLFPPSLAFNIGDSVELSELTNLSVCA